MTLPDEFLLAFAGHFGSDIVDYDDEQLVVDAARSCVSNLAVMQKVDLEALKNELGRFLAEMDRETVLMLSAESNVEWFEDLPTLRFVIMRLLEELSSYMRHQPDRPDAKTATFPSNDTAKHYRQVDIESIYRMIDPLEREIIAAFRMVFAGGKDREIDAKVAESIESIVFDTLDEFPQFSEIIDAIEQRLNQLGVTLYAASTEE